MAVVYETTLVPSKLELLTTWLPGQPWYRGGERPPVLVKSGGFRIDDPQGAVGIEIMAVTDESGSSPVTYLVPLAYRGAPVAGAEAALLGTTEHGVLGRRWVYDGTRDPVVVAQLFALALGTALAQAQSMSDTADPTVIGSFSVPGVAGPVTWLSAIDGPASTDVLIRVAAADPQDEQLIIRVNRLLGAAEPVSAAEAVGDISAQWRAPGGDPVRVPFVQIFWQAGA